MAEREELFVINLIKPQKLRPGDKVATVSLSGGTAGREECRWRYEQGKERLQTVFGLEVVEMPHTLASPDYLEKHPEARAADMMTAFADPSIKGIISCIGGEDTIRLLPYINFDVIKNNPKIFLGYSDSTVNHFMCYKAGLSSFYGAALLIDFAENVAMHDYTVQAVKKALFSAAPIGEIDTSPTWTSEYLPWVVENINTARKLEPNHGYEVLQGSGKVTGRLIGGCIESMEWLRGTVLLPPISDFDGAILFFETSQDMPLPRNLRYMLRAFAVLGVFEKANGIIFGKPYDNKYYEEYKPEILRVLREYGREELPVLYNASIGHCDPHGVIPYGALAEIDCENAGFSILESGVV
jgi:muramoyltetrapeptide carboxypeptidase LdcA involved in peptidoglycan recycling